MYYIVVGLFPSQAEVDQVLLKLENAGYYDFKISHSDKEISQNIDVEKKNGFWSWLFDDDYIEKKRFEYASIGNNTITVNLETEQSAHTVRDILDHNGAINVQEKTKDYITDNYKDACQEHVISESKNAKIIAKAKNNLFFTNTRRHHHSYDSWIANEPDGLGFKIN